MVINKKRIRSLAANLPGLKDGHEIVVSVRVENLDLVRLQQVGFSLPLEVGQSLLPSVLGPVSRYNAEGKHSIHRDQPKETCFRQVEWRWTEHHGQDEVERSDFRDVPYERYPRTFVPPPSIPLEIRVDADDRLRLVAPAVTVNAEQPDELLHAVNLLLEVFRHCEVTGPDLVPLIRTPLRVLNWRILPAGMRSWEELEPLLAEAVGKQGPVREAVSFHRLRHINGFGPSFCALGHGGFAGYVVLGFPERNIYVCECTRFGNATYVFESDWERLTQMTKGQILDGSLHKDRLVHVRDWEGKVAALLKG